MDISLIIKFIIVYCLAVGIIGMILIYVERLWNNKKDWGKACDYMDAVEDKDIDKIMELNENG